MSDDVADEDDVADDDVYGDDVDIDDIVDEINDHIPSSPLPPVPPRQQSDLGTISHDGACWKGGEWWEWIGG